MLPAKRVINTLLIIGAITPVGLFFAWPSIQETAIGVIYDLFISPPKRTFCLETNDPYKCITERAIETKNPADCYFLDMGRSDQCVSEVIATTTDPEVCKRIPRWSFFREDCLRTVDARF